MSYKLLLGADPELFLKKGRSYASAHGIIPGTKYEPHKVDKGAVQVDGMAVEFNIDPCDTPEKFVDHLQSVMETLDVMVGDHKLIMKPSVIFNEKVWKDTPEDAKILGCEPDYNAYTGKANDRPNNNVNFRTASGHVHIGWTEGADINSIEHHNECRAVVKALDRTLGIPSVVLDPDKRRRTLYGKAGAYRPKSYGVEYRVLSNFWLQSPELMSWVFNTVQNTLYLLHIKEFNKKLNTQQWSENYIQMVINRSLPNYAKNVILYSKMEIPDVKV